MAEQDALPGVGHLARCGGQNLAVRPAVVTAEGRLLLVAAGAEVAVYSLPSATRVGTLSGHTSPVTGIITTSDSRHAITGSLDGSVKTWDVIAGRAVSTVEAGGPVTHLQPAGPDAVIVATAGAGDRYAPLLGREVEVVLGAKVPRLPAFTLARLPLTGGAAPTQLHSGTGVCTASAAHPGHPIAAFAFRKQVLVWEEEGGVLHALDHSKPLTALTLNGTTGDVVAGDVEGQVWTWPGVVGPQGTVHPGVKPTGSHWHASAALCVAVTAEGGYLLSGGAEGVLVIQQASTGARSFVPRLGAAVRQVTCATTAPGGEGDAAATAAQQLFYVASLGDNTIAVVEASTNTVTGVVRHMPALAGGQLTPPPPAFSDGLGGMTDSATGAVHSAALAHHAASGGFMVPAATGTGHLQVYGPGAGTASSAAFKHSFRVTPRNAVSGNEHTAPATTLVTHTVGSGDGSGLMTVECPTRGGRRVGPHTLRFFAWAAGAGGGGGRFALQTYVDMPITDTGVAHVAWRPGTDHPMVVTAAPRRTFRLWDRVRAPEAAGSHLGDAGKVGGAKRPRSGAPASAPKFIWRCRSVGFYRDAPIGGVAFSGDGSLLAVSTGGLVPLWCPITNAVKAVLSHPESGEDAPVHSLAWMGSAARLLTASPGRTTLWDVVTCTPLWTYAAHTLVAAPVVLPSGEGGVVAVVRTRASELAAAARRGGEGDVLLPPSLRSGAEGDPAPPASTQDVQHIVVWSGVSPVPAMLVALDPAVPPVRHVLPLRGALDTVMLQCADGSVWEAHTGPSAAAAAAHDSAAVAARVLPATAAAEAAAAAMPAPAPAPVAKGEGLGALHTLPPVAVLVPFLLKARLTPARVTQPGKVARVEGGEETLEVPPVAVVASAPLGGTALVRTLRKMGGAPPTALGLFA